MQKPGSCLVSGTALGDTVPLTHPRFIFATGDSNLLLTYGQQVTASLAALSKVFGSRACSPLLFTPFLLLPLPRSPPLCGLTDGPVPTGFRLVRHMV